MNSTYENSDTYEDARQWFDGEPLSENEIAFKIYEGLLVQKVLNLDPIVDKQLTLKMIGLVTGEPQAVAWGPIQ